MYTPFPRHSIRSVECLDGLWSFAWLGKADLAAIDPAKITFNDKCAVPSAWDSTPAYAGKRGTAAYRTTLNVQPGRCQRLRFEAISMWCRIYVDGKPLIEHASGFSAFWVDLPASDRATRELIVLADNRYDRERVPLHEEYYDFYQWGGIIRSVWLHQTPETYIASVAVRAEDWKSGAVSVRVALAGKQPSKADVSLAFDGGRQQTHELAFSSGVGTLQLMVPKPRHWSPAAPNLHTLAVAIDGDDYIVRFGLRDFNTDGPRLVLNDEPIKLLGYNRHESHPQFGPATPLSLMIADLQQLRDLGCNFIRGSHYPQDQRFLDLCDEFGFLVWEETLGWHQQPRHFSNTAYIAQHRQMSEEMVAASINHPSVVIWGLLNECDSNMAENKPQIAALIKQLRELDPSRLISFATMYAERDICQDLVDIISLNIYPGWYGCEGVENPHELIAPRIDVLVEHFHKLFPAKPIIISEIGAEGLYGWRDAMKSHWSEDYQQIYLRTVCEAVAARPEVCGLAIWHFSDARTYQGGYALGRARAFNNKGTVDEYRRPKLSYPDVKRVFTGVNTQRPG